jgi:hypothetical protein
VYAIIPAFFFGVLISKDISFKYLPALYLWVVALDSIVRLYLQETAHRKLTALVESYQPIFLQQYGVELGYRKFAYAKLPSIYLRRSRRSEDEEAPVDGNSKNVDGANFPPFYLVRLIPGQIHMDENEYDATSMKVDAETWSLLQSTHRKMIQWQWHPFMNILGFVVFLGFFVGFVFLLGGHSPCGGFIWVIVGGVGFILTKVFVYAVDNQNLRVYAEVTKVVNQALQEKDKEHSLLAIEFHDSEVPGREGKLGRRYQFVQRDMAPATKDLALPCVGRTTSLWVRRKGVSST